MSRLDEQAADRALRVHAPSTDCRREAGRAPAYLISRSCAATQSQLACGVRRNRVCGTRVAAAGPTTSLVSRLDARERRACCCHDAWPICQRLLNVTAFSGK